jgi:hypothetical protein
LLWASQGDGNLETPKPITTQQEAALEAERKQQAEEQANEALKRLHKTRGFSSAAKADLEDRLGVSERF